MQITQAYIEGVKDGRVFSKLLPREHWLEHVNNLEREIESAVNPTAREMARGERDFFVNQLKKGETK